MDIELIMHIVTLSSFYAYKLKQKPKVWQNVPRKQQRFKKKKKKRVLAFLYSGMDLAFLVFCSNKYYCNNVFSDLEHWIQEKVNECPRYTGMHYSSINLVGFHPNFNILFQLVLAQQAKDSLSVNCSSLNFRNYLYLLE